MRRRIPSIRHRCQGIDDAVLPRTEHTRALRLAPNVSKVQGQKNTLRSIMHTAERCSKTCALFPRAVETTSPSEQNRTRRANQARAAAHENGKPFLITGLWSAVAARPRRN